MRQRRSTRAFDPRQAISAECFYRLLRQHWPQPGLPPWDQQQTAYGLLHLLLFVHRVDGLSSGLYLLAESPDAVSKLRAHTRPEVGLIDAPPYAHRVSDAG